MKFKTLLSEVLHYAKKINNNVFDHLLTIHESLTKGIIKTLKQPLVY
jgi:hypothetical protein